MTDLFAELGQLFSDHQLFLVGGSVRDKLLGREAKDLDFATDAEPEVIRDLLGPWADAVWDPGLEFGTIAARKDGQDIEITTFRADGPGRKPKVVFVKDLVEDLRRRDFTINAMAIEITSDGSSFGEITDPFRGMAAAGLKILDTPMAPERSFGDDPLRMLRAARFVSQLGFDVSVRVEAAMIDLRARLNDISAERIHAEMDKLLIGEHPEKGLQLLWDTGLLPFILPEVGRVPGGTFVLWGDDVETRWADLLRKMDPHEVKTRLRALKFSNERVHSVANLVALADRFKHMEWFDPEVRKALAAAGPDFKRLQVLLDDDVLNERAKALVSAEGHPAPFLTGGEVMSILDLNPGPKVGEALQYLWNLRLEMGPMSKREVTRALLDWDKVSV